MSDFFILMKLHCIVFVCLVGVSKHNVAPLMSAQAAALTDTSVDISAVAAKSALVKAHGQST
jgi:hypothetical protein